MRHVNDRSVLRGAKLAMLGVLLSASVVAAQQNGGIAGSQTLTLMIRSIALGRIQGAVCLVGQILRGVMPEGVQQRATE